MGLYEAASVNKGYIIGGGIVGAQKNIFQVASLLQWLYLKLSYIVLGLKILITQEAINKPNVTEA